MRAATQGRPYDGKNLTMSDSVQAKTDLVKLTIDGKEVEVPQGTLLIEAARKLGIEIPFFCYHQKLEPDGNCRMCLVSIEKMPKLQVSCSMPVAEGMSVQTNTPVVEEARKTVLDFLLANHPLDCPVCDEGGRCPLQDYSHKYTAYGRFDEEKRRYEKSYFSPLIEKEMNRCIQCMRCVRYCDEVIDSQALSAEKRGFETEISHYGEKQLECEFCGGCIQICPVGALLNRQSFFEYRPWMVKKTETTCSYCADGCSYRLETRDETKQVIEVTSFWGNEPKTVWGQGRNEGDLCAKGYFGQDFVNSPERITRPMIRRDGILVETSWEEALEATAEALGRIKERNGGAAFGVIGSGRLTNENLYGLQKFARLVLGTPHIDSTARYGLVSAARALTEIQGSHRWLTSYEEIAAAEAILVIGSDITQTNPITALKVKAAAKAGAKLIVASPLRRRISTKSHIVNRATRHLAHFPGAERAVAIGLVKAALEAAAQKPAGSRPAAVKVLEDAVRAIRPAAIESATGLTYGDFQEAASELAGAGRVVILFGDGVIRAPEGEVIVRLLGDLAHLLGIVGRTGSGLAMLLEENNEMGCLEMGVVPDGLPGLRSLAAPKERDAVSKIWREPIPEGPGLTMLEMLGAAREGRIKALYLVGENPVGTLPSASGAAAALEAAEFVVCHELFLTETARRAHVVFPAASYAEQNGTFTNQEGRVQPVRKAFDPVAETRPDWEIFSNVARYLGCAFDYQDGAEISHEIANVWPEWRTRPQIAAAPAPKETAEVRGARYEIHSETARRDGRLMLFPGPVLFHSGRMSMRSHALRLVCDRPLLYLSPEDADRLNVADGDSVKVRSAHGEAVVPVARDGKYPPGMAHYPLHGECDAMRDVFAYTETERDRVPIFGAVEVELAPVKQEVSKR